jgi:hypothetical protein
MEFARVDLSWWLLVTLQTWDSSWKAIVRKYLDCASLLRLPAPIAVLAVAGVFTPVLAKHSKSFSLVDCISAGVDRMQRNFESL